VAWSYAWVAGDIAASHCHCHVLHRRQWRADLPWAPPFIDLSVDDDDSGQA
jgi:hypothetical protein